MILLKRLLGRVESPGRGRHSARSVAVASFVVPAVTAVPVLIAASVQRVTLGFEDGTEVALPADDPRSRAFQTMAGVLTGQLSTVSEPSETA
jgi:hypothetical protein